ncbi:MAG: carbohydrate porin, partial [Planctomycetota bacterium]
MARLRERKNTWPFPLVAALLAVVAAERVPTQDESQTLAEHLRFAPRLLGDLGGHRRQWEDQGVSFDLYYNAFFGINAKGGANTNGAQEYSHSVDLLAWADTGEMGLWSNGLAFLMAKHNSRKNINPDVGALSDPIDDADFNEPIYIDQLWYEHGWLEDRIRFRFGYLDQQVILDRNAFSNSEDVQFMSTYLDNNPIVPLKIAFGATLFVETTDSLSFLLGTADAENEIKSAGFDTAFDDFDDLMAYFEVKQQLRFDSKHGELPGNLRLGIFYDPRSRPVFGSMKRERGEVGGYFSGDQLIYREGESDEQGLGVFARYGLRDDR